MASSKSNLKLVSGVGEDAVSAKLQLILQCVACASNDFALHHERLTCSGCQQVYLVKHGIVDSIVAPSPSLTKELQGMAREAGMEAQQWQDYKIRQVPSLPTLEALQAGTEGDAGHYYKQTMMNFEQARALLPVLGAGTRVLEIGSEAPFAFLKGFRATGAECHALNIYFPLTTPDPYSAWPIRTLGDMNHLPYRDASFDVVVMSATSHHTPTPELLLQEVSRVLKPGGKALLINDPLAGLIKGVGGSLAHHRDPLINENTYTLGRYQRAFDALGFNSEHLFSAYWEDRLQTANIHPQTRFATLARILARLWRVAPVRHLIRHQLLWAVQVVFGFPLNVVLSKPTAASRSESRQA
jgi:SAM-dependent methyltransferase